MTNDQSSAPAPQRTPEWHVERKGRVTASMVGAILGLSPYMDREDAMRTMVRAALGLPGEFTGNVATEWGNANEAGARFEYEMQSSHEVSETGFHTHEDWLGASPDGLIGKRGLVEIKCPYGIRKDTPPAFHSIRSEALEHYFAQVQVQIYVTRRDWCHFYQWTPHGTRMEMVEPDGDWIADNIPRLRQFHAEFLYELNENADDYREPKRIAIDTPEAAKLVSEYDDLSDAIDRATERKKEVLAEIAEKAGGRNALFSGRKLTLVEKAGAVSYAKAIKALVPDADLAPYTGKPSSYWKLS